MLVNKIERLSSGNVLLSFVDNEGIETPIKAFFPDSGAKMMEGNLIKIARQNGSDFRTFAFNKVDILIGKSGVLAKPTTKAAFYKLLFTEFFLPFGGGSEATDVNITGNTTDFSNATLQQCIIDFLQGASNSTTQMPTPTQAQTTGTEYMMRTIKALAPVTLILKDLSLQSQTLDAAYVHVWKNANIDNDAGIIYTPIPGTDLLEEGTIEITNPTPQTRIDGGEWQLGLTIDSRDSLFLPKLNKMIELEENDILLWSVIPQGNNLDISMYQSFLQK